MRRTATTGLILSLILLAIVGLNLVFYSDPTAAQETEQTASRSTYSDRIYGTRAFYLLLQDLGYDVTRFVEPVDRLQSSPAITALIIVSPPSLFPYSSEELVGLEDWVKSGGHLVLIDRQIDWPIAGGTIHLKTYSKYKQWRIPHIIQPTSLTAGVKRVQLTEFAQGVLAESAPVIDHVGDQNGSVLSDFHYGKGRIIMLGDPYVVANNGLAQSDNLVLALNIVRSLPPGRFAFDEYHHGHGLLRAGSSGLIGVAANLFHYFRRTPVIPIFAQLLLLAGVWVVSRGRRFGRPVAVPAKLRQRSLEYVTASANLARRLGLRSLITENALPSGDSVHKDPAPGDAEMSGTSSLTVDRFGRPVPAERQASVIDRRFKGSKTNDHRTAQTAGDPPQNTPTGRKK